MARSWSTADIPDLVGRRAVVTGANSGIGYAAALRLAERGAEVTLTARDPERGARAIDAVERAVPGAKVVLAALDLADLASVREFAAGWAGPLHLLVNNAGVMAIPKLTTADGFEMQLGTNHFGHFALTGLLIDSLLAAPDARVVTVSSTASYIGKIAFDDLDGNRRYTPWSAYGQSKLANLLFTEELERRFRAADAGALAVAAHPGYAHTNLQSTSTSSRGGAQLEAASMAIVGRFVGQSADGGALPTLYAATSPAVEGGKFYGPRTLYMLRGGAGASRAPRRAHDLGLAARLWDVSVARTGVDFATLSPAAA
jgi:NAD(P)-dependent dehydrogenase (short-subunit alcohol dehydrogenase family)